jgi:hypothetical protein
MKLHAKRPPDAGVAPPALPPRPGGGPPARGGGRGRRSERADGAHVAGPRPGRGRAGPPGSLQPPAPDRPAHRPRAGAGRPALQARAHAGRGDRRLPGHGRAHREPHPAPRRPGPAARARARRARQPLRDPAARVSWCINRRQDARAHRRRRAPGHGLPARAAHGPRRLGAGARGRGRGRLRRPRKRSEQALFAVPPWWRALDPGGAADTPGPPEERLEDPCGRRRAILNRITLGGAGRPRAGTGARARSPSRPPRPQRPPA